jgi:hypothetical protein
MLGLDLTIPRIAVWFVLVLGGLGALGNLAVRRVPEPPAGPSAILPDDVRKIFEGLDTGDGAAFFGEAGDEAQLHTKHLIANYNHAAVLHSPATANDGMRFDNRYCQVVEFRDGLIVSVRAYPDSVTVARLFPVS